MTGSGQPECSSTSPGNIIIARDGTAVVQPARLSLHDEHPERLSRCGHQRAPHLPIRRRGASIELPQLGEGRFQHSPHAAKRGGLLLDEFVLENLEWST